MKLYKGNNADSTCIVQVEVVKWWCSLSGVKGLCSLRKNSNRNVFLESNVIEMFLRNLKLQKLYLLKNCFIQTLLGCLLALNSSLVIQLHLLFILNWTD